MKIHLNSPSHVERHIDNVHEVQKSLNSKKYEFRQTNSQLDLNNNTKDIREEKNCFCCETCGIYINFYI